ncbi:hypothetical protein [Planctomicrobium piriforme]|uniref:hypothetical protein n=1 Tax=Planctomicrobium piriforme TaxID=1576369 RepID=UPI00158724D5|nr:hypothetical protein [Planctomicrobium piriforme]
MLRFCTFEVILKSSLRMAAGSLSGDGPDSTLAQRRLRGPDGNELTDCDQIRGAHGHPERHRRGLF